MASGGSVATKPQVKRSLGLARKECEGRTGSGGWGVEGGDPEPGGI